MERRHAIKLMLLGTASIAIEVACGSIYDRNFETTIDDIAKDPKRFYDWHGYVKVAGWPVLFKKVNSLDVATYAGPFPIMEENTDWFYEFYRDETKEGPKILIHDSNGKINVHNKRLEGRKGEQTTITIIGSVSKGFVPGQRGQQYYLSVGTLK